MSIEKTTRLKVALLGNPNAGKSSLFNHLTGLNQKIGNFPGVTVDKKVGTSKIGDNLFAEIIDLPGTYSLYPKSLDEQIVLDLLHSKKDPSSPDLLLVVIDASTFKRNMLLFTQIRDLGFPVILVLNMLDLAEQHGIKIDPLKLEKELNVPIVAINARTGAGIRELKAAIACPVHTPPESYYKPGPLASGIISEVKESFSLENDYQAILLAHQYDNMRGLPEKEKEELARLVKKWSFDSKAFQSKETIARYDVITRILKETIEEKSVDDKELTSTKIDRILTHKVFGYLLFFFILLVLFQSIFAWASFPMDMIDGGIAWINGALKQNLPGGPFTDLLTDGLIAGLGGVLIFIPQIAILFAFIAVLEESGYMSRVMFLMDKLMRPFGMSGRSVVPLISGVACAVPAIMSTRSIENWKERLITIFVTPLMSCSARIPVFTILIALVVPEKNILGFFNLQGIVLMALYLLGFLSAIISGFVMNKILQNKQRSFFIMELPSYRIPRWKNVGLTIYEKVKTFVLEAGKVIVAISVVLWVLASYGPGDIETKALDEVRQGQPELVESTPDFENAVSGKKLELSYAGKFGHFIEPVIRPLGFDWKIGVALITSFAAREVFIGTMSTIYSVGDGGDDEATIKQRMKEEINPKTGGPMYTPALAFSLLIFYLFAMQCMSTLAVVYRETKGWTWPLIQLVYMTGLAYGLSFITYNIFS